MWFAEKYAATAMCFIDGLGGNCAFQAAEKLSRRVFGVLFALVNRVYIGDLIVHDQVAEILNLHCC